MRQIGYFAAIVAIAGCGGSTPPSAAPGPKRPPSSVRASRLLAADANSDNPSAGLACARANYVPCDRVGLGVRLRQPAVRVLATVGNERFVMKMGGLGGSGPRYWEGYATRAGLTSSGPFRARPHRGSHYWAGMIDVRVSITAVFRDGRSEHTTVPVTVRPGWG